MERTNRLQIVLSPGIQGTDARQSHRCCEAPLNIFSGVYNLMDSAYPPLASVELNSLVRYSISLCNEKGLTVCQFRLVECEDGSVSSSAPINHN